MKKSLLFACAIVILVAILCGVAFADNEAWYFSNGRLYIPHVNLLDNHGNTLYSYSVFMRKESQDWRFRIDGLGPVAGSATSSVSTNVSGSWSFSFTPGYNQTFNGTNFSRTSIMTPTNDTIPLVLVQSNQTVTGTGIVSSVRYSLNGAVDGHLFLFRLLVGASNGTIAVAAGQAVLSNGTLGGDYVWSATNGATVKGGTLSATQN